MTRGMRQVGGIGQTDGMKSRFLGVGGGTPAAVLNALAMYDMLVMMDDPIVYYPLRDPDASTYVDDMAHRDAGDIQGTPNFDVANKLLNSGMALDGSTNAITSEVYDYSQDKGTLEAWFRATSLSQNGALAEYAHSSDTSWYCRFDITPSGAQSVTRSSGTSNSTPVDLSGAHLDGEWHLFSFAFDKATGGSIFYDGVEVETMSIPELINHRLAFGANRTGGLGHFLEGDIALPVAFPERHTATQVLDRHDVAKEIRTISTFARTSKIIDGVTMNVIE